MDHTNVCTIHEADESESGELFLVMPCHQDQTVREKIGAAGALPIAEVLDIARQRLPKRTITEGLIGSIRCSKKTGRLFIVRSSGTP